MSANSRRTLERIADRVPVPEPAYDRLIHRRERKERNRRIRAGTLALVLTVLGAAIFLRAFRSEPLPADRPVQPSPIEHVNNQSTSLPPIEGLKFPMLPMGAQPSTPNTGDSVVTFKSSPNGGFPVEMATYADGRVIWHPDRNDVGYFQLRLTPAGLDTIRSTIISTGLFDHDLDLVRPGTYLSRLSILRGDRWVFDQWADDPSWWAGSGIEHRAATVSEARDLGELDRLLGDPSAWQLSSDLYADAEIRPFVPSGFMLDYDRSGPDLSKLPSPVRTLLARYSPGSNGSDESNGCNVVTADVAREIVHALARAGYAPRTNSPTTVDYNLPGSDGSPSNLHLSPVLPDPCWSHQ